MSPFIRYSIEANVAICFFLLLYQILLREETDHQFKRAYLLLALVISVALPFFHFQLSSPLTFEKALPANWLPETIVVPTINARTSLVDSFWFWIFSIYGFGAAIFFVVFLIRLLRITTSVYSSTRVRYESLWVFELRGEREVFSFFKFIFIGDAIDMTETEKSQIIRHERVHIDNFHSIDILLVNVLSILFWFNPFLQTYRKSFVQLHEFEADARSVDGNEIDSYCCLLAKAALTSSGYQLANHFTNSLTLKRIEMMKTIKTKIEGWKIISITVVAFSFCCLIACTPDQKNISSSDEVFDQVDELPTFGSKPQYTEVYEFIAKNLKYPEVAMKKGIEGKVFTQFIVEKDGTVTNVSTVKGIGSGCDEAAATAIKLLSPWNPGKKDGKIVRTSFVLPIEFRLSEPKKGG